MKSNCIRIVSGHYRKRYLRISKFCKDIRPTQERARVCVFDILSPYLSDKFTFFDGFCGYGSMGIEALSRGADLCVFYDINPHAIQTIRSNLLQMDKLPGRYYIFKKSMLKLSKGQPMNVIFLDPPYSCSHILSDVIKKLIKFQWVDANTIIVCVLARDQELKPQTYHNIFKTKIISCSQFVFLTIDEKYLNSENVPKLI